MRNRTVKNLLSFLLALVLTLGVVAVLSAMTPSGARAARVERKEITVGGEQRETAALSATVREEKLPVGWSILAFGGILVLLGGKGISALRSSARQTAAVSRRPVRAPRRDLGSSARLSVK